MDPSPHRQSTFLTLKRFNNLLTFVVIALALYIAILPFLPKLEWWAKYEAPVISKAPTIALPEEIPKDNTLIIPSLGLKERVYDGKYATTLRNGIWHRPNTSSPDKGGNTVFAGHRFTYSGAAVFYNLDKVNIGDPLILYWENEQYSYTVSDILTVPSSQVSIEETTEHAMLTIYTCTPLWSAKDRLVIQAKPVEAS